MSSPESHPLRLLVVDDDDTLREGYAELLNHQPDVNVVATARNGLQAVERVSAHLLDAVLMDIEMPRMDGVQATRAIHRTNPTLAIIMLTAFDERRRVNAALKEGARGYLTKDASAEEIVEAVRHVLSGQTVLGRRATRAVFQPYSTEEQQRLERLGQAVASLPEGYRQVLKLICEGRTNADIASRLSMAESSVRTYVSRIMQACECSSRTELAVRVLRADLV